MTERPNPRSSALETDAVDGASPESLGGLLEGRYRLLDRIASGGQAEVWRGWDDRLQALVALKLGFSQHPDAVARLEREARLGNLLGRMPGFLRVTDIGRTEGGRPFLVMDYVPRARSLAVRSEGMTIGLWTSCCKVVSRAHGAGVVHRDINPRNFLIGSGAGRRRPELFLIDFGLARFLTAATGPSTHPIDISLTETDTGMGTLPYTAPEQLRDAAHVDLRADIYSLGVLLHLALTSSFPYPQARTHVDFIEAHELVRTGRIAPPLSESDRLTDNQPEELLELCRRCLAVDPVERPTSVSDMFGLKRTGEATSERARPSLLRTRWLRSLPFGGQFGYGEAELRALLDAEN